ncbi:BA75_03055T0 [Komagataella pastoris]|uniref:5-formyltetrahydrofolate cyclo-ligase n=1 Tax=Komagataella pastoris TaxID=4922 RepID=A0A1B2JD43_PICPA|nr:BA75_03055T0 [Komagataella pastoris]
MSKATVRSQIKKCLAQLSVDHISHQSNHIASSILTLPEYQNASKIALYMNMPHGEVQTLPLIRQIFEDGKRLFLPRITKLDEKSFQRFPGQKSCLQMLEVPNWHEVLDLKPRGVYKLLEPESDSGVNGLESGIDIVVLPGVAFTKDCYRMGHGAGFYDDYIKRFQESGNPRPLLIGIGLEEQLVDSLPVEAHDEKLDYVLIDNHIYRQSS